MADQLQTMRAFVRTAETGSFAAAGAQLNLSAQMIGRYVASLEKRLGVRLLNRSTHAQSLTDAGHAYLDGCRRVLAQIEAADDSVSRKSHTAHGWLRVTAPVGLGTLLCRWLPEFMDLHPALNIELHLSDKHVDLVAEGFDAAIRIGHLPDSTLVSRSIGVYRCATCASPAYLERHGLPGSPAALVEHACLDYRFPAYPAINLWTFQRAGEVITIQPKARLIVNDGRALIEAAINGFGIVQVGEMKVRQEIADGRLTRLFADWDGVARPIQLVTPDKRHRSAASRQFAAWVGRLFETRG